MPVTPWPPVLGRTASADGCITRLHFIINRPTEEIERRVGYSRGRLDGGWWLLLLTEAVQGSDFEFFGYTNSSGGLSGHPREGDRDAIDASLRQQLGTAAFLRKQEEVAAGMAIKGPERIAKIVPRDGKDPTIPADEAWRHFPPGSGIPQWSLVVPKRFVVAADISDGRRHCGGGAGFWLDPQAARTMKD